MACIKLVALAHRFGGSTKLMGPRLREQVTVSRRFVLSFSHVAARCQDANPVFGFSIDRLAATQSNGSA